MAGSQAAIQLSLAAILLWKVCMCEMGVGARKDGKGRTGSEEYGELLQRLLHGSRRPDPTQERESSEPACESSKRVQKGPKGCKGVQKGLTKG